MASFSLLITLLLLSTFPSSVHPKNTSTTPCPLDFSVLRRLAPSGPQPSVDAQTECRYILLSLRLLFSDHLRRTGKFLPPPSAAESCWSGFQSLLNPRRRRFDIRSSCGFNTDWISRGCMNITTRAQFESLVPASALADVASRCDQSLMNASPCASCTTVLADLPALYLTGNSPANLSDCTAYPSIYAAAFSNRLGPADPGTARCLFNLNFPPRTTKISRTIVAVVVTVTSLSAVALAAVGALWWARKRRNARRETAVAERERGLGSMMDSINGGSGNGGGLVKYSFEEVKKATGNFSRHNMIGHGGYGNVYRGVLADGAEVALKRFKNCSAAGDAGFAHEVEVIASVRHVNLVALRGYCTATTAYEGHQRIIVCDLMSNGSLHDHLSDELRRRKLSWPARRKIALGTAHGVAYLHHGAQPAIIHRDIKANNILLDDALEARVADFGLARFTPEEGMMASHVSTRVAGTMGYVAPEYALYGQLSERSDVYSFGVVLLELLSGKTALLEGAEGQPLLLTDWAWGLVREGRAQDVVEDNVPEKGPPDELERYVLVAVLCSHPQVLARPTMDQVVKILESDLSLSLPSIPERPLPIVADIRDIERSMSSASSVSGTYQPSPRGLSS